MSEQEKVNAWNAYTLERGMDAGEADAFFAGWQASRRAALEEAAKVCDMNARAEPREWSPKLCAMAIRALAQGGE